MQDPPGCEPAVCRRKTLSNWIKWVWNTCVRLAEVNSQPGDARSKIALKIPFSFHPRDRKIESGTGTGEFEKASKKLPVGLVCMDFIGSKESIV